MSMTSPSPGPAAGQGKLSLVVTVASAVAAIAAFITMPRISTWYVGLAKPAFMPPFELFAPASTVLYAAMAAAGWRLWTAAGDAAAKRGAFLLLALQAGLNALWPIVFFGLQKPVSALIVSVFLAAIAVATVRRFYLIDPLAGVVLAPYLAWVLFATVLNAAIVGLNP
jgi:translocator protein